MAQPYQTQEEYEAQLQQPVGTPVERDLGLGGDASPGATPSGGAATAPTPLATNAAQTGGPPNPQSTAPTRRGAPIAQSGGLPSMQTGAATPAPAPQTLKSYSYGENPGISESFKGLFEPLTSEIGKDTSNLTGAEGTFEQAAGPHRTFESVGGKNTISGALEATAKPEQTQAAKDLVGAQYSGPQNLDQVTMDAIQQSMGGLQERGNALNKGGGLQDLIEQQQKGLTPGEARFTAQKVGAMPEYQQARRAAQQDIGQLGANVQEGTQSAADYATQRGQEEDQISQAAKGILQGEQSSILGSLDPRVQETQTHDAAVQKAYDDFIATGDINTLLTELPAGEDPSQIQEIMNDPTAALGKEAQTKQAEIQGQFADIKDVPMMENQITSHGLTVLGFPKEWYDQFKKGKTPQQLEDVRKRAVARQQAFEQSGFSPGVTSGDRGVGLGATGTMSGKFATGGTPGKYEGVDSLYFGGGQDPFQTIDPKSYIQNVSGPQASRANMATDQERQRFNAASGILGIADRIEQSDNPHEKQKLIAEGDRYMADMQDYVKGRTDLVESQKKGFYTKMQAARKAFKQKRDKKWADAFNVAINIVGVGLPAATGGLGSNQLGPVAQSTATAF